MTYVRTVLLSYVSPPSFKDHSYPFHELRRSFIASLSYSTSTLLEDCLCMRFMAQ